MAAGEATSQQRLVIEVLRMHRMVLAATTGAVLALTGAVAQGLFRNPLADPSLLGVSAGARLGLRW